MHIALLCFSLFGKFRGNEVVFSDLSYNFGTRGHTVFVLSNHKNLTTHMPFYVYHTPRFITEFVSRIMHIFFAPFILSYIHLFRHIDVIQAAGIVDFLAALPMKLLFRIPVVIRLSDFNHPHLLKRFKFLALFADSIITLNAHMNNQLMQIGFNHCKIVLIPNGVDLKQFGASRKRANSSRVVILWIGALDSHKYPQLAIDTMYNLTDKIQNVSLIIVGEGNLKDELVNSVIEYNLHDKIYFFGHRNHSDIAEVMSSGDIFLITSKGEGMSNTLLEAMASELAIVATSASTSGIIQDGFNGLIANTPEEISSAILKIIADPLLRYKIQRNARKTVMTNFSKDLMMQNYLDLYSKLKTY